MEGIERFGKDRMCTDRIWQKIVAPDVSGYHCGECFEEKCGLQILNQSGI